MVTKKMVDAEIKTGVLEPAGSEPPAKKVISPVDSSKFEFDQLDAVIPADRESCMQSICSDVIAAMRYTTLKFWMVGRTIDTLQSRGEKNVIEEVMERTGYEKRTIQYTLAVYKAVPDPKTVKELCTKGTEWSHFKQLVKIKDDSARNLLVSNIIEGNVKPSVALTSDVEEPAPAKETKKAEPVKTTKKKAPEPAGYIFEGFTSPIKALVDLMKGVEVEYPNYLSLVSDESRVSKTGYDKFIVSVRECIEEIDVAVAKLESMKKRFMSDLFDDSEPK